MILDLCWTRGHWKLRHVSGLEAGVRNSKLASRKLRAGLTALRILVHSGGLSSRHHFGRLTTRARNCDGLAARIYHRRSVYDLFSSSPNPFLFNLTFLLTPSISSNFFFLVTIPYNFNLPIIITLAAHWSNLIIQQHLNTLPCTSLAWGNFHRLDCESYPMWGCKTTSIFSAAVTMNLADIRRVGCSKGHDRLGGCRQTSTATGLVLHPFARVDSVSKIT